MKMTVFWDVSVLQKFTDVSEVPTASIALVAGEVNTSVTSVSKATTERLRQEVNTPAS
jgi:hypothetical protein